ncbi:MAG: hypothetical protein KJO08_06915 [Gammaproteobacteria bacterium]|nr:hypothetical protein [Gammaproteobacteria bacterium]NNJ83996.1 hypothetical protein [Gammaproteobacteria bacterium]
MHYRSDFKKYGFKPTEIIPLLRKKSIDLQNIPEKGEFQKELKPVANGSSNPEQEKEEDVKREDAKYYQIIDPSWNLADPLTVQQAAALLAGVDPNYVYFNETPSYFTNEHNWSESDGISLVKTTFSALTNAIDDRKLKANLRYDAEPRYVAGIDYLNERAYWEKEDVGVIEDREGNEYIVTTVPDWSKSTIDAEELRKWLSSKGHHTGFFFPDTTDTAPTTDAGSREALTSCEQELEQWKARTVRLEAVGDKQTALQTEIDRLSGELRNKGKEIEILSTERNELKADELEGKARSTALKIIGGMAMDAYGINIHADRLERIGEMVKDFQLKGVNVTEKTLSTWIKKAAEVIEPRK